MVAPCSHQTKTENMEICFQLIFLNFYFETFYFKYENKISKAFDLEKRQFYHLNGMAKLILFYSFAIACGYLFLFSV